MLIISGSFKLDRKAAYLFLGIWRCSSNLYLFYQFCLWVALVHSLLLLLSFLNLKVCQILSLSLLLFYLILVHQTVTSNIYESGFIVYLNSIVYLINYTHFLNICLYNFKIVCYSIFNLNKYNLIVKNTVSFRQYLSTWRIRT